MGHWKTFCDSLGHDVTLSDITDADEITQSDQRLSCLLVYGLRYRRLGQKNKPVRADTVGKAITAVGKGIADMGLPDPRIDPGTRQNHTLLTSFLKAMADEDAPSSRAYPANVTHLRGLHTVLHVDHPELGVLNAHIIDLIIVAFWWLLRPAEYLHSTTPEARSQAFTFGHIHLTMAGKVYPAPTAPLNDSNISSIEFSSLEFDDQKNAVRGEQVGHKPTNDPLLCPCKALGRICLRLQQAKATPKTPIHHHFNSHPSHQKWCVVWPRFVTNALRHAGNALRAVTGIDGSLLSARSLRPGGATALLCANVDKDAIMLLGRWKSDAMLRYLRIQATSSARNYAQQMLDHGTFTFQPGSLQEPEAALPNETPVAIAALLSHEEAYFSD